VLQDEISLIEEALNAPNVPFKSNYDAKPEAKDQSKQTLQQK